MPFRCNLRDTKAEERGGAADCTVAGGGDTSQQGETLRPSLVVPRVWRSEGSGAGAGTQGRHQQEARAFKRLSRTPGSRPGRGRPGARDVRP